MVVSFFKKWQQKRTVENYDEAVPQWHFPITLVHRRFNLDWNCQNSKQKSTWNISCIPLILHDNSIFNKLLQKICFINKIEKTEFTDSWLHFLVHTSAILQESASSLVEAQKVPSGPTEGSSLASPLLCVFLIGPHHNAGYCGSCFYAAEWVLWVTPG